MKAGTWVCALAVVALAWLLPGAAQAGAKGGGFKKATKVARPGGGVVGVEEREKPSAYVVAQAGSTDGKVSFEAMTADELKDRLDGLADDYAEAAKEWMLAKKEAEKKGEKFVASKPVKPFIHKYSDRVYRSAKEARAAAEKLQKQWDAWEAKKKADL